MNFDKIFFIGSIQNMNILSGYKSLNYYFDIRINSSFATGILFTSNKEQKIDIGDYILVEYTGEFIIQTKNSKIVKLNKNIAEVGMSYNTYIRKSKILNLIKNIR